MATSVQHRVKCVGFLWLLIAVFGVECASDYTGCSFMSTCDVMSSLTAEMERQRPTKELQAIKSKMDQLVDMEYEFSGLKFDFLLLKEQFVALSKEVSGFTSDQKAKAEELKIDGKQQNRIDKQEERVKKVEDKVTKLLDGNGVIKSLQEEVETLKNELIGEKSKFNQMQKEKLEQDKKLQQTQDQLANLQTQFTKTKTTLETNNENQQDLKNQIQDLKRAKDLQENLHLRINNTSQSTESLIHDLESHLEDSISSIVELTENKTAENRYKLHHLSSLISNQSDSIELLHELVKANEEQLNETTLDLLEKIRQKADIVHVEQLAGITTKVFGVANETSKKYEELGRKFDESMEFWLEMEDKVTVQSKYVKEIDALKGQLASKEIRNKQMAAQLKLLEDRVENVELAEEEVMEKLINVQNTMEKLHVSLSATEKPQMDKKVDKESLTDGTNPYPLPNGNSPNMPESCMYYKRTNDLIASINGRPITAQMLAVPDGQVITFRCKTVGSYRFHGSVLRQCINGTWLGEYPVCGPLVSMAEVEAGNVSLDATPSILIYPIPDSSTTGVLPDGTIIVTPGSKVTLSCLFSDASKLQWTATTLISQQPQIMIGEWNPDKHSLDIPITARASNSRNYTCTNKFGGVNSTVRLLVKSVTCDSPISNDVIKIVGKSDNVMNSEIHLQCTSLNHYMVWPGEEPDQRPKSKNARLTCLPSGVWSNDWPTCSKLKTT